ncbi:MAG: biotin/lipoyl-containing protein, partial [Acidobacteriota bacterium]
MSLEVVMPQMGESITEGTVSKWLKAVGDKIEKDEAILEISTDKVDAEVPSPGAGVLLEIRHQEGETVEVGTVVAVIGAEGDVPAATPPAQVPTTEAVAAPVEVSTEEIPTPEILTDAVSAPAAEAPAALAASGPATEVVMPQMGESITEGTVSKWLKAVGDKIDKDEPLLEISTDKVDAEVPSPVAGTLLEIRAVEGETVEVGS